MPRSAAALALALLLALACSNAPRPAARASPVAASPSPAAVSAGPCRNHSAPPAAPSGPRSANPLWQLAGGLDEPDDLLFHDGSLVIGELHAGRIDRYTPGLGLVHLPYAVPTVEGMVYVGDRLLAADQRDDRLQWADDGSVLLQLTAVPGKDGVDGIATDGKNLLVPDSPNGDLLWFDPSTRQVTRKVGGFNRPTGAWPEPDGSVLVADEYGDAAYRIRPDGSRETLVSGLPIVDDVAADSAGKVFVVTPVVSGGRLAEIAGGRANDLVSALVAPQGLVFDAADNAIFSEEDAGRVDLAIRTFKLVPINGAGEGEKVCIDVARAPGFGGDITFTPSPGVTILTSPHLGSQGEVVPQGCTQARPCELTARSGGLVDRLWIAGAS